MGTDANVIIGAGVLYYASTTEVLPTITGTVATDITWTSWTSPGYQVDNVELVFSEESVDFIPIGFKTALKDERTRASASGRFTIGEADADALALAFSGSSTGSTGSTGPILRDGGNTAQVYKQLAFETDLCVYNFKKARILDNRTLTLSDTEWTSVPMEFKAFANSDSTATGRVWEIHERTST